MKKLVFGCALLLSALMSQAVGIESPEGKVAVDFSLTGNGVPTYEVKYKGVEVIKPSTLGLELNGANDLMNGCEVVKTSTSSFDETWTPVWGETKTIRNNYNELLVELKQPSTDRLMNLRFRVYD